MKMRGQIKKTAYAQHTQVSFSLFNYSIIVFVFSLDQSHSKENG